MDYLNIIIKDFLFIEDLILHHMGLFLITVAFIFIAYYYYVLQGPLQVPSLFFFLYGFGGLILMTHMGSKDYAFVATMEFISSLL